MKVSEHLSALGILAFAGGASSFLSAPIASLPSAMAQQTTNTTTSEGAPQDDTVITEGYGHESGLREV
jgi:hypothetical protein